MFCLIVVQVFGTSLLCNIILMELSNYVLHFMKDLLCAAFHVQHAHLSFHSWVLFMLFLLFCNLNLHLFHPAMIGATPRSSGLYVALIIFKLRLFEFISFSRLSLAGIRTPDVPDLSTKLMHNQVRCTG